MLREMAVSAIRTSKLSKDYGAGRGLFELDLEVLPREVFGYLGPNGAGKPVTELRLSLPPGRGRWTGRRLALASAAVCRSPETA
jgi:ABC-type uncharacterized transport system ATPase subunit